MEAESGAPHEPAVNPRLVLSVGRKGGTRAGVQREKPPYQPCQLPRPLALPSQILGQFTFDGSIDEHA